MCRASRYRTMQPPGRFSKSWPAWCGDCTMPQKGSYPRPTRSGRPIPSGPGLDGRQLVSHMDYCPGNVVFRAGLPAALIDFDLVRPATRLADAVNALYWWAPLLHPLDRAPALVDADIPGRVAAFADAYGMTAQLRANLVPFAVRRGARHPRQRPSRRGSRPGVPTVLGRRGQGPDATGGSLVGGERHLHNRGAVQLIPVVPTRPERHCHGPGVLRYVGRRTSIPRYRGSSH
jgi:hypothetical protein